MKHLRIVFLLLFFFMFFQFSYCQKEKGFSAKFNGFKYPSIGFGTGILSYHGDLRYDKNTMHLTEFNPAYTFSINQRFSNVLGISVNALKGVLSHNLKGVDVLRSFKSDVIAANAEAIFYLDNNLFFRKSFFLSPFVSLGFGYIQYESMADLKDANGNEYFLWPNGLIRDVSYFSENQANSKSLIRDYDFESPLDPENIAVKKSVIIPISAGVDIQLSRFLVAKIKSSYCIMSQDNIDNYSSSEKQLNDSYILTSLSICYNLGKRTRKVELPQYMHVDFSELEKIDSDGDGIVDFYDKCYDTNKMAKIDRNGCAIDSDGDGVPNYLDLEPFSLPNVIADSNGVAIDNTKYYDAFIHDSLISAGVELPPNLQYDTIININLFSIEQQMAEMGIAFFNESKAKPENDGIIVNPEITNNALNPNYIDGITYRVQIASVANDKRKQYFKDKYDVKGDVYISKIGNLYKYLIGDFVLFKEAKAFNDRFRNRTGHDSFIVAFKDGEKVSMTEVKKLIKLKRKSFSKPKIKDSKTKKNIRF